MKTTTLVVLTTLIATFLLPTFAYSKAFNYPVERVILYPQVENESPKVFALVIYASSEKEAEEIKKKIEKTWDKRNSELRTYLKAQGRTWYLTVSTAHTYHHKKDISDITDYPPLLVPLKPDQREKNFIYSIKTGDQRWEVIIYIHTPLMDKFLWEWEGQGLEKEEVSITNEWQEREW